MVSASPKELELGDPPDVTVVVVTANRSSYLRDCLKSVLAQDFVGSMELIVVDDGSKDDTREVVADLSANSPYEVRYVGQVSQGINAGRNRAIESARSQLVCFIDDDEIAPPDWLNFLVRGLLENSEADGIGGTYVAMREHYNTRWICRRCLESYKGFFPLTQNGYGESFVWKQLVGGNCLIRAAAFKRYGLFDPELSGLGDDTEWFWRAGKMGGRFLLLPDAWVWHRVKPGELTIRESFRGIPKVKPLMAARARMGELSEWRRDIRSGFRFLSHGMARGCVIGITQGLAKFLVAYESLRAKRGKS